MYILTLGLEFFNKLEEILIKISEIWLEEKEKFKEVPTLTSHQQKQYDKTFQCYICEGHITNKMSTEAFAKLKRNKKKSSPSLYEKGPKVKYCLFYHMLIIIIRLEITVIGLGNTSVRIFKFITSKVDVKYIL